MAAHFIQGGERGIRTLGTVLQYTRLASEHLRPLGHLSVCSPTLHTSHYSVVNCQGQRSVMASARAAEEEGFEPPALSRCGFQDRCLRPLGHSSTKEVDATFSASGPAMQAESAAPQCRGGT